ncbi:MAG: C25 family cysteine peptidase, partial [Acidobacteriota bacterium]
DVEGLDDRAADAHLDLEIHVKLLGWSQAAVGEGSHQHLVQLRLGGVPVGVARWNGRLPGDLRVRGVPAAALDSKGRAGPRLTLKVLPRAQPQSGEPVIDLVYVDWVEIRYRVGRLERGRGPWLVDASDHPSWLPDAGSERGDRLLSAAGWSASADPRGGFRLPPRAEPTEVWIVGGATWQEPRAVNALAPAAPVPEGIDYLMIAPPTLLSGIEPLADRHRRRGLRVAVASTATIFDHHGHGYDETSALRRFVDRVYSGSPSLRYVLLVGDADWRRPPRSSDRPANPSAGGAGRGLVPAGSFLSAFGPAASDHELAAFTEHEAWPRFAVGRLPVADGSELERVVQKILGHLDAADRSDPNLVSGRGPAPGVLMISDRTTPSRRRLELSKERLGETATIVLEPSPPPGSRLDSSLVAAFDRSPAIVHFNGHGSRHSWQLGDAHALGPDFFFDREDVARLAPSSSLPVVLSVSCTTAPFDHPSAPSLGEAMLLADGRGAVAFIGASSRLYTVPLFGERIVRRLVAGGSVGDAFVAAKRELDHVEISWLYQLLGDPAVGLTDAAARASTD